MNRRSFTATLTAGAAAALLAGCKRKLPTRAPIDGLMKDSQAAPVDAVAFGVVTS